MKCRKTPLFHVGLAVVMGIALLCRPAYGYDSLPVRAMQSSGAVMILLCMIGRSIASLYACGRKGVTLLQEGPYAITRNPLYACTAMGAAGAALQHGSLAFTGLCLALLFAQYCRVVRSEERYLSQRFGAAYEAYCARVPRLRYSWRMLLPRSVWLEVNPSLTARTMLEAACFFLAILLFQGIHGLQQRGWIEPMLALP